MTMPLSPQCRDVSLLCRCIRHKHKQLLSACIGRDVYLVTIETLRALDRQKHYVKKGVSKTLKSLHLPQPPHQKALAVDVVPNDYLTEPNWYPDGEQWDIMIEEAERVGLKSGFKLWGWDKPHLQQEECSCDSLLKEQAKEGA
jgi:hypothetical protein